MIANQLDRLYLCSYFKQSMKNQKLVGGNLPVGLNPEKMNKSTNGDQDYRHNGYKAVKLLPNVRKFRIEVSQMDIIFALFGIEKRLKPKMKFFYHTNKSLNRYVLHQLNRMTKSCKTNPILCWRIGMRLVRRSNVFFVMALNHVFPKWHRNMKLSSVVRLAIAVRRIANNPESKLDFKRVYLEEPRKWRPLGVPTPAWRIYLHMMNVILTFYYEASGKYRESQHGFRPGRGTLTAWRHILKEVIKAKDIYEFDLKGFFDSINLDYIAMQMTKDLIPHNIVKLFYYINTCACLVKPPYRLNEFEHMMKSLIHKGSYDEVISHPRPLSYMYRVRGVPQGAPTSPSLSLLGLHDSILDRPGINTIMYADDGLYYGDLKDTPLITPNSGIVSANISFNHKKSGWIKKDGKWLKPLKFLGLIYDGESDKLQAQTRKGASLEFDKMNLVKAWEISRSNPGVGESWETKVWKDKYTFEDLAKSKLFGFIQSRLYQGSWNMEGYEQMFELSYEKDSYCAYSMKLRNKSTSDNITVFNASTFASEWLVKKLRSVKSLRTL
jgi:hypothetical protein